MVVVEWCWLSAAVCWAGVAQQACCPWLVHVGWCVLIEDGAPECINGQLAALADYAHHQQKVLGELQCIENLLEGDLAPAAIHLCGCAQHSIAMD